MPGTGKPGLGYAPGMIRNSHVIAAFVGVVLAGWLQWSTPGYEPPKPIVTVLFVGVTFGLLWECAIRLSVLIRGLLGR